MNIQKSLLALALFGIAGWAQAAPNCAIKLKAGDDMKFDQKSVTVSAGCKSISIELQHSGKLPVTAMGHNWVLSTAADESGVIADGGKAGPSNSYEKPGDTRIIAHTKLIGGGQSDTATIDVAKLKAGDSYAYFCSFPGHSSVMKGTVTLAR